MVLISVSIVHTHIVSWTFFFLYGCYMKIKGSEMKIWEERKDHGNHIEISPPTHVAMWRIPQKNDSNNTKEDHY